MNSFAAISAPHSVAAIRTNPDKPTATRNDSPDFEAARLAIAQLWQSDGFPANEPAELPGPSGKGPGVGLWQTGRFPADESSGLGWRRDALGKPFVVWSGSVAEWAEATGRESRHLHISNTHDGGAHIVIAAYSEMLAGIGIDVVWLPRLRRPGKGTDYLHRFAQRFMSREELAAFAAATASAHAKTAAPQNPKTPTPSQQDTKSDPDEPLRLRVAAHFSLMEAASKACGTGLKIGVGMGKPTSLPKQSLGAARLSPDIELLFGPEAKQRLEFMGVTRYEASVQTDPEFLVSVVALYRHGA